MPSSTLSSGPTLSHDGNYTELPARRSTQESLGNARISGEYGGDVSQHTLGKWVSTGRTDLKAGKRQTVFALFAQRYDQVMEEHCNADANTDHRRHQATLWPT